jgi:hypothetical protein
MAIYITGLVLIIGAVELVLALVVASHGTNAPPASSLFWPVYLAVLIALVVAGALLIARGLGEIHRPAAVPEPAET